MTFMRHSKKGKKLKNTTTTNMLEPPTCPLCTLGNMSALNTPRVDIGTLLLSYAKRRNPDHIY